MIFCTIVPLYIIGYLNYRNIQPIGKLCIKARKDRYKFDSIEEKTDIIISQVKQS